MKQLSLLLVLTALLTACTTEIGPVTTNEPKKLIINAILSTDKVENAIYLNLTDRVNPEIVKNGIIRLYINGELSETIDECKYNPLYNDRDSYSDYYYPVHSRFQSGDNVRLEVETKDGHFRAEAETNVYENLKIAGLDTTHITTSGVYSWIGTAIRLKVKLEAPMSEKKHPHYYRVHLKEDCTYRLTNKETLKDSIAQSNYWNSPAYYYDIALMDGKPGDLNNNDFDITILPTTRNDYRVFSDIYFNNRKYTMDLSIFPGAWFNGLVYHIRHATVRETLHFYAISQEEYLYLRALSAHNEHDSSDPFENPVIFPSNVKGGIGIFAIENLTEYPFDAFDKDIAE